MAELNIVTQNKPEIVDELEYFSEDESEKAMERLGVFQSEFTLKSSKSSLQRPVFLTWATTGSPFMRTWAMRSSPAQNKNKKKRKFASFFILSFLSLGL